MKRICDCAPEARGVYKLDDWLGGVWESMAKWVDLELRRRGEGLLFNVQMRLCKHPASCAVS